MYEVETTLIISLPLSQDKLERVARECRRIIQKRTASGLDKSGNKFKPYSDEYKESAPFKATGQSTAVDLRLSGEMMTEFDVVRVRDNQFALGFDDAEQRAKAHGHTVGKEGGSNVPKREFIGLSKGELESALRLSGVVKDEKEVETIMKGAVIT